MKKGEKALFLVTLLTSFFAKLCTTKLEVT
jgi:hypothetical protein